MASKIPFVVGTFNHDGLTHAQRVCRLYKATLVHIQSYMYNDLPQQRKDMLRVRHLIEKNKHEKDRRRQKLLYEDWVELFQKYKHNEPIAHPDSPDGTAYDRQIYIPRSFCVYPPMQAWFLKEWQLENNVAGLKEWEWDKRPAWRDLVTRNHRRSHLIGYEDDV